MQIKQKSEKQLKSTHDKVIFCNKISQLKKYPELLSYQEIIKEKIQSEKNEILLFFDGASKIWLVLHFESEKNTSNRLENFRALGSRIQKQLAKEKCETIAFYGNKDCNSKDETYAILEGLLFASYQFLKYKTKNTSTQTSPTIALVSPQLSEQELQELHLLYEAVNHTKDLVNEPVITLTATAFSNEMKKQGKRFGFDVEVLNKKQIVALKMGGLLGVNAGSEEPPTFSILSYKGRGAKNKKPIVFVGKGVVFDTGGYSLKISGSMQTMKCDMAGAAAVLGAISAIAANKLPLYVIGLIPATDNMISGKAIVVDDVLHMHNGSTVEVQNTDAEGRLILADALSYAKKYSPELVIDLATLTGAAAAITGPYGSAMVGNNDKYKKLIQESGEQTYERVVELPYWREFGDLLKSDIADIRNIGGPIGGATTAGKFLEHFTDYNWVHLDIAGPSYLKEVKDHHHKGASAVGVRLLYQFAKQLAKKPKF